MRVRNSNIYNFTRILFGNLPNVIILFGVLMLSINLYNSIYDIYPLYSIRTKINIGIVIILLLLLILLSNYVMFQYSKGTKQNIRYYILSELLISLVAFPMLGLLVMFQLPLAVIGYFLFRLNTSNEKTS